uniref:Retrovirus-related Pol polyprotein from type-1 retrotransposable element R1 4 n=1 Tax=Schizaphis graminum TaxID=13262 RepID=A0A2S2P3S3_SCHGA
MAAQILTRMPPAYLLADERRRIEVCKRETVTVAVIRRQEREVMLRDWQELWDHTTKAVWRLIPGIRRWMCQSRLGFVSFHMAQALSGHGCFQNYLWKRRRPDNLSCNHYKEAEDTAEHTLLICPFRTYAMWEMEQAISRQ